MQGAAHAGARHVIVVDPMRLKRDTALRLGATHAFAPAQPHVLHSRGSRWRGERELMRVAASHGEPASRVIRLLLVDDHALVVSAMTAAFEDVPDIDLVATASTVADALAATARHRPDVVLLDRRLPDGDGVEAIGRLRGEAPDLRVLVFTGTADRTTADRVADAGGAGILLKAGVLDDMLDTVRRVAAGASSFDIRPSGRPTVR